MGIRRLWWQVQCFSSKLLRLSIGNGGDRTVVPSHEPRRDGEVGEGKVAETDLSQLDRGEGDEGGVVEMDDVVAVLPKDSHELGREEVEELGEDRTEEEDEEDDGERRHSEQRPLEARGGAAAFALPFRDRLQSSSVDDGAARRDCKRSACLRRRTWLLDLPGPLDLDLERALLAVGLSVVRLRSSSVTGNRGPVMLATTSVKEIEHASSKVGVRWLGASGDVGWCRRRLRGE